ncbi:MAG: methyltransferase [Clostridia bacterium]|nr:methyltransferase [Clostridia bacterium]
MLFEGEALEDIGGGLKIIQSRNNYRFSEDSILLADFVDLNPGESLLDLGTGSGILPLLLIRRERSLNITGIEIQQELASMAQRSIKYNNLEKKITIVQGDLREAGKLFPGARWDKVIANPPYFRVNEGRISHKNNIAIARHEIECTLTDIVKAAGLLLKPMGSFYIVYGHHRLSELLSLCKENCLCPYQLQPVSAHKDKPPYLVLVKCLHQEEVKLVELPTYCLNEA